MKFNQSTSANFSSTSSSTSTAIDTTTSIYTTTMATTFFSKTNSDQSILILQTQTPKGPMLIDTFGKESTKFSFKMERVSNADNFKYVMLRSKGVVFKVGIA